MAYQKQTWTDRNVENPRTYTMVENQDGTVTLIPAPGTVTAEGTPVSAARMNHIEDGIDGAVCKAGDTMTGTLNIHQELHVSYNNANGVRIWADNEGGNIVIVSPDGHSYQFDVYDNDFLRLFAYDDSDNLHNLTWYRADGRLYVEVLNVGNAQSSRASIGAGCPSGTFTTVDGKTITVTDGFITSIQ